MIRRRPVAAAWPDKKTTRPRFVDCKELRNRSRACGTSSASLSALSASSSASVFTVARAAAPPPPSARRAPPRREPLGRQVTNNSSLTASSSKQFVSRDAPQQTKGDSCLVGLGQGMDLGLQRLTPTSEEIESSLLSLLLINSGSVKSGAKTGPTSHPKISQGAEERVASTWLAGSQETTPACFPWSRTGALQISTRRTWSISCARP